MGKIRGNAGNCGFDIDRWRCSGVPKNKGNSRKIRRSQCFTFVIRLGTRDIGGYYEVVEGWGIGGRVKHLYGGLGVLLENSVDGEDLEDGGDDGLGDGLGRDVVVVGGEGEGGAVVVDALDGAESV